MALLTSIVRGALVLSLACVAMASGAFAQVRVAAENELKAAYLYNIAKFVEWPATAFAPTGGKLVVGILGDPALASTLAAKLSGKQVQGRSIVVRAFGAPQAVVQCQVLFVTEARTGAVRQLLGLLGGAPVLVVGQDDRLISNGGVVNFYIEEDRIRFEICPGNADALGLKISSKLLRLARIVR